jgi:hypothetical protein
MGYAFTEDATEVYQDVLKEVPKDADSDQIWGAMQMKMYNPDQIQFQRDQFSAASLEEHETVADLSKKNFTSWFADYQSVRARKSKTSS